MDHSLIITTAAQSVCDALVGIDYLENNFRILLARELRRMYEVYEEVVIPYNFAGSIPFGHGFADIVLMTPGGGYHFGIEDNEEGLCTAVT